MILTTFYYVFFFKSHFAYAGLTLALSIAILLGTIYPLFLGDEVDGNPSSLLGWVLVIFGCVLMMGGILGLGHANAKQKEGRERKRDKGSGSRYELTSSTATSSSADIEDGGRGEEVVETRKTTTTTTTTTTMTTTTSTLTANQQFILCAAAGVFSSFMQWVFLAGEDTIKFTEELDVEVR